MINLNNLYIDDNPATILNLRNMPNLEDCYNADDNNLVSVDFTGSYRLVDSVNLRNNSINSLVLPDSTYGDPWYCTNYGDCGYE